MAGLKRIEWLGNSREDLRLLSSGVRSEFGRQLFSIQKGEAPSDYKSMQPVGAGVFEVRVRSEGAWRLMYVAKYEKAIYVLHVFQKKTQKTLKSDIEIARRRYKTIVVQD